MELTYWIEHDQDNKPGRYLWVYFPQLPAGQTTIYVVRVPNSPTNKHLATYARQVFPIFDDFEGSLSGWLTGGNGGTVSVSSGKLHLKTTASSGAAWAATTATIGYPSFAVESLLYWQSNGINARSANVGIGDPYGTKDDYQRILSRVSHQYAYNNTFKVRGMRKGDEPVVTNEVSMIDPTRKWWYMQFFYIPQGSNALYKGACQSGPYSYSVSGTAAGVNYRHVHLLITHWGASNTEGWFEWVFVRKYIEPFPTVQVHKFAPTAYSVVIDNPNDTILNIQIPVPLSELEYSTFNDDLYVTATPVSLAPVMPYWIEHDQLKRAHYVWIPVPLLGPHSSTQFTVYRKPGRTPSGSDVFVFYDDFSDLKDWSVQGKIDLENTELIVKKGSVYSSVQLPSSFIAEVNVYCGLAQGGEEAGVPTLSSAPKIDDTNSTQEAVLAFAKHDSSRALSVRVASGNSAGFDLVDYVGRVEKIGWYRLGVSYRNGTVKLWKDGQVVSEIPNVSFSKALWYLILGHHFGQNKEVNTRYDWVRVRPYVEPEPTVEVQDMGFCYVVTVTNNTNETLVGFPVAVPAELLGVEGALESLYIIQGEPISFSYWYEQADELYLWIVVHSFVLEKGYSLKIYLKQDDTSTPIEPLEDAAVVENPVLFAGVTAHYSTLILKAPDTYISPFAFRVPARMLGITEQENLRISITKPAPTETIQKEMGFTVVAAQGSCAVGSANYQTMYCSDKCPLFKRARFLVE